MADGMTIWDLKRESWTDEPRYYPPGQHPAMYRHREQLRGLEELKREAERLEMDTSTIVEVIDYISGEIANFEARESELKARDDRILHGR